MVIDSSAFLAILQNEAESLSFQAKIEADPVRLTSAATMLETSLVVIGRRGEAGLREFQGFIAKLKVEKVIFDADQLEIAVDAFRRYGKGRHPAALNFGDCFSYALARSTAEPLLFKGNDFSRTDIRSVAGL